MKTHGNTSHGHSKRKYGQTPTYISWSNMVQRCTNPSKNDYPYYGGRGVLIDPDWFDFRNFLKDMGEKPEGKSLDRIDNDGDYCKENCRWATKRQQTNNQKSNKLLKFKGKTQTCAQWSREVNLPYKTLYRRIYIYGWSVEKALTTPVRKWGEGL